MLQVDITHAFVLLAGAILLTLLCLSLYDSWRARSHSWTMTEEYLGECSRCRLMFLASRYESTIRCPRCGTLVQASRRTDNGSRARSRRPAESSR